MTHRKVLILRSVSLQQLDQNLPAILTAFPAAEFHLLTHPHAINECRKFPGIAEIIPLPSAAPFSPLHLPRRIRRERYAATVVPVANQSGAGFLNVSLTALASGATDLYLCNMTSRITRMSKPAILGRWLAGGPWRLLALVGMLGLAPVALLWMLLSRLPSWAGTGGEKGRS